MQTKLMVMVMAGMLMAYGTVAAEKEEAPKGQRPHPGAFLPPPGEGGDMGEAFIARALAPDSPMAKQLNLTAEQIEALKAAFKGSGKEMNDLRTQMRDAAIKQAELMSQEPPDEAAVIKGVETIGQIRLTMAKIRTHQVLAALKVLTPEQRASLRDMMKERREKMGDRMKQMKEKARERRGEGKACVDKAPPKGEQPPPGGNAPPPAE